MCALLYLWILDQNLTTLASLSSDGKLWIHEKKLFEQLDFVRI